MNYSLDQLMKEASKLPPIPQAVRKALTIVNDPEVNLSSLACVIETDQVLAAHVLRWANSAFYGVRNKVATVHQAIVVLGNRNVQELIMTHSVSDQLNKPLPGYELRRGDLWQHALGTAIGAKLISQEHHLKFDEQAYFAGLLCDIGKLVFERLLREVNLQDANLKQHSFLELERAAFGIDHARLGAEIARLWQLPENLVDAIANHHEPQAAENNPRLVAAVHVADVSMMMMGIGIGIDGLNYPLEEEALQSLNMTGNDIFILVEKITEQLTKAKELINLG